MEGIAGVDWLALPRRWRWMLPVLGLVMLLFSSTALAAEVVNSESEYRLHRGETISDDLYVTAAEIFIDGTVEGDVVAAGGYVEISGVVKGDIIIAGGGINVTGVVQDDARLAGAGITVSGSIGDDLFVAGGGFPYFSSFPIVVNGRTIVQGVRLAAGSSVGGDASVIGSYAELAGSVREDLHCAVNTLVFSGRVGGNANLQAASLQISDDATVEGELTISSADTVDVPDQMAPTVVQSPPETAPETVSRFTPLRSIFGWTVRTILIILGLALLGGLLMQFRSGSLTTPVAAIEQKPVESALYGILLTVAALPVSAFLVLLAVLFWGWFPGGVTVSAFLFGLIALLWLLSPIVSGLWLGRRLVALTESIEGDLVALFTGIVAIVLVTRLFGVIPCFGTFVYFMFYLLSFSLAIGGWILSRYQLEPTTQLLTADGKPGRK